MISLHLILSAGLSLSTSEKLFRVNELSPLLYTLVMLSIGGSLAFGLGFSEFLLVSKTSSLTLSIAGIFKVRRVTQYITSYPLCIPSAPSLKLLPFTPSLPLSQALLVSPPLHSLFKVYFSSPPNVPSLSPLGGVYSAAGSRPDGGQDEWTQLDGFRCLCFWHLPACGAEDLLFQK